MNYYVTREGQQYGPYSLADLQRYVGQGNIQPTDLARSDGMQEWVPVSQILGNIPAQQQPPAPNYGQVPVYNQAFQSPQPVNLPGPVPIGLHWGLVLLLAVLTCFLFSAVWIFVEAAFVHKLRTNSKPLLFYGIGIPALFAAGLFSSTPELQFISGILNLLGLVLVICGHFSMRNALEEYYNSVEPIGLQLSGVMTFFFNVFYFQYHLSRIRDWKLTGILK